MTGAVISLRPWGYTLSVWLEGNLSAEEVNRIDAALISTIGVKGTFFHYKVHSEQRQLAAAAKAKAVPAEAVDEVGARTGTRTKKVVVLPEDSNPSSIPPCRPPHTHTHTHPATGRHARGARRHLDRRMRPLLAPLVRRCDGLLS